MPWELGYFDALRGRCAVVPVTMRKQYEDYYKGQEYLGLYPYMTRTHGVLYPGRGFACRPDLLLRFVSEDGGHTCAGAQNDHH